MKPSKIKVFFQSINAGQKAFRNFLAKIIAGDVIRAESKARSSALNSVIPDFASRLESAELTGKERVTHANRQIADAQNLLAKANNDRAAGAAFLKAIALLKQDGSK